MDEGREIKVINQRAELITLANGWNYIQGHYFKITKLSDGVYHREESSKPL